jgi:predicted site-specific integrase-resolvase
MPELLTEEEAARFLRISPKTLMTWRSIGRYRLAFVKVGGRVRYEQAALRDFIEKRRVGRRPSRIILRGETRFADLKKTA